MNHKDFRMLLEKYQTNKPKLDAKKALKLTSRQEDIYIAMLFLDNNGHPITARMLTELMFLETSTINTHVKGILNAGLIEKKERLNSGTFVYKILD